VLIALMMRLDSCCWFENFLEESLGEKSVFRLNMAVSDKLRS
jgi:hypothetical protein